jgi:small subunit ribosomal protein S2
MSKTKGKEKISKKGDFNLDPEEMAQAGLHFGHKTSKIHPKMEPYLYGTRNSIHIIDLEKTKENFEKALKFIKDLISENKNLLLVGTKVQVKNMIKDMAKECNLPYVNERWLGGTFTNFGVMKKRIAHLKDLEEKKRTGELEKYTKKERAQIDQEIEKLKIKFEGIKDLESLPEAIFVVDMKKNALAIKGAKEMGVKVIAISDTNVDPTLTDYPIPANDDAISSVKYILEKIKETILKAQQTVKDKEETVKDEEKTEEDK